MLGIDERDTLDLPIVNASTSRVKTLIPLVSPMVVNALRPNWSRMEALCDAIGSTGLYPFACDWDDERTYHARQFPKASGYPEDAATGVAATALIYGLQHYGLIGTRRTIRVRQGEAMGRPSRLAVTLAEASDGNVGCWLSGDVRLPSFKAVAFLERAADAERRLGIRVRQHRAAPAALENELQPGGSGRHRPSPASRARDGRSNSSSRSIEAMTSSRPSPVLMLVKTNGRLPRPAFASRSTSPSSRRPRWPGPPSVRWRRWLFVQLPPSLPTQTA